MKNFQAKPEYWELQEQWSNHAILGVDSSCFLELRSRVEALEAQANHFVDVPKMVPPPVATDEELWNIWNKHGFLLNNIRAVYDLGIEHGQIRSQARAMTDLSPAAQAIAKAAWAAFWSSEAMAPNDAEVIAAAALRAVADQVVPEESLYGGNQRWEWERDARQSSRKKILAIATELEALPND
jgi:hypothetical protein